MSDVRKAVIVKSSRRGEAYLNHEPIGLEDLTAELTKLKDEGYIVVYYREPVFAEPGPETMKVVQAVVDARIPIQMGDKAPPEWGLLNVFMLYVAPFKFRFALFRENKSLTFAYLPTDPNPGRFQLFRQEHKLQIVHGEDLKEEPQIRSLVNVLVSSNRVLESPQNAPQNAFQDETQKSPSFHLVVTYEGRGDWMTWYPLDQLPQNMQSLWDDCMALGLKTIGKER